MLQPQITVVSVVPLWSFKAQNIVKTLFLFNLVDSVDFKASF